MTEKEKKKLVTGLEEEECDDDDARDDAEDVDPLGAIATVVFNLPSPHLGWGGGGEESRMVVAKREGEGRPPSLFRFSRFLLFPNGKKGGGELSREAGDRRRMLCFFSLFRRVTVC